MFCANHRVYVALKWCLPNCAQTCMPFARKGEVAHAECMRIEVKLANGHDMRLDMVRRYLTRHNAHGAVTHSGDCSA